MGISFTPHEARILRDAIRTDYAIRENIIETLAHDLADGHITQKDYNHVVTKQANILADLDIVDSVLASVYRYQDEMKVTFLKD